MKKLSRFGFLMALLFIGGSDDSGHNSKTDVLSADDVLESIPKVESFKDLPNCSKNREDSIMVVLDEEIAYGCVDKHWIALGELHENEDALPSCYDKREGMVAYVLDVKEKFLCSNGSWDVAADSVPVVPKSSQSKDSTGSSDSKNGDEPTSSTSNPDSSGDPESSNSKSENSSSSTQLSEKSSSSVKSEGNSADSEAVFYETSCGEVPYTVKTAGPNSRWGSFGYVLPLKVTSAKKQELYLAFDTTVTGINGPDGWEYYGVVIAQYDSEKKQWIPGTEIFSENKKNATTVRDGIYGNVNTYGLFEKFSFDVKGTWLENQAGKTVDVVVNFYAPGVPSDSSGMGFDYYSIPSDTLNVARNKLYYSESKMECSLPLYVESTELLFSCVANNAREVYEGDTVVWNVSGMNKGLVNKSWFSISSEAGKIVSMPADETYGTISSIYVVYPTRGAYKEKLSVTVYPGVVRECTNSMWYHERTSENGIYPEYNDTLEVLAPPARNCSCVASTENPDAATAGSFTLSAKGCVSEDPITAYAWGYKYCSITKFGAESCRDTTWDNANGIPESSFSVSFKAGERTSYEPFVKVTNKAGSTSRFTCPTINIKPLSITSNVFAPGKSVDIPAGTYAVTFDLNDDAYSYCSNKMRCTSDVATSVIDIMIGNKTISENIDHYGDVNLSEVLTCPSTTKAIITASTDMKCELSAW